LDFWTQFDRVFPRTYTYRILENFWELLSELYPYLAAGILIVALLQRAVPRLHRLSFLRSCRTANIFAAAVAGTIAPLSVYLAVPISAVFILSGIPAPVVVAFLFACPILDPNLLLLTYGALGWQVALARLVSALCLGFAAGLIYRKLGDRLPLNSPKALTELPNRHTGSLERRNFWFSIRRQSLFIVKIFSVSLLLSAAIKALVPPEYVRSLFGQSGYFSILLAIALGVPFYQCGGASIPIMQALYELGLSKGAILAFFISGPATKIPALYAFREGYGTRFLSVYLIYTLAGAFAAGVVFNLIG